MAPPIALADVPAELQCRIPVQNLVLIRMCEQAAVECLYVQDGPRGKSLPLLGQEELFDIRPSDLIQSLAGPRRFEMPLDEHLVRFPCVLLAGDLGVALDELTGICNDLGQFNPFS